jgi:hypothetical protein
VVCPEATVTLAGTVTTPLLVSDTAVAPAAALFNDTVQVLDVLLASVRVGQDSEVSCAGATRLRLNVVEALFALAVSTTL